jgi:flagellar basal-body rod protein FlgB
MADSSGISFGQTIDLLGHAVQGSKLEKDQIANNIANVNTPNFRRSTTNFREALADTLGVPPDPDQLTLATDNDRQFEINGGIPPQPFDPKAFVDTTDQARVDGSNVDIDQEMALLSENSGYSQTISQLMSEQYKFLRQAATESPS